MIREKAINFWNVINAMPLYVTSVVQCHMSHRIVNKTPAKVFTPPAKKKIGKKVYE